MENRKERVQTRDRLGRPIDLASCPACPEHETRPDCFAYINGRCVALAEVFEDKSCPFYKSVEKNTAELKASYQRLISIGRIDLVTRHRRALIAMGVFDEAIDEEEQWRKSIDNFRERDFREQMEKAVSIEAESWGDFLLDGETENGE